MEDCNICRSPMDPADRDTLTAVVACGARGHRFHQTWLKDSVLTNPLYLSCVTTPVPTQLTSRDTPYSEAGTSILAGNMFKNLVEATPKTRGS